MDKLEQPSRPHVEHEVDERTFHRIRALTIPREKLIQWLDSLSPDIVVQLGSNRFRAESFRVEVMTDTDGQEAFGIAIGF